MPLINKGSKSAFSKNVATEMDNGKPQNQSLAIAYSMKSKAKKKKMAEGGIVRTETASQSGTEGHQSPLAGKTNTDNMGARHTKPMASTMAPNWIQDGRVVTMADGGMVDDIMKKRRQAKAMAEGGMVDLEENGEEMPNSYYELNEKPEHDYEEPILKENLESEGHPLSDEDMNDMDMISKIRERMKTRRGF